MRAIVGGLLAILVSAWPAAGVVLAAQPQQGGAPGSITALDREFLTVIRFANLWEIPMGQLAVQRGTTKAVKDTGATLAADHTALDVDLKKLAAQFNVSLPDTATSSQQSWMAEISSKTGTAFDHAFADRLRAAHGTVFGLVAEVRAGTRNDVIRAFAQSANNIVMKHMTLLEGTGLVASHSMFAEASARTTAYPENKLSGNAIVMAIVLGLLTLVATLVVIRIVSSGQTTEVRAIMKG